MNKLQQQIQQLLQQGVSIRKRTPSTADVYSQIVHQTANWPPTAKIRERIFAVMSNLSEPPVCECGSILKFLGPSRGYRSYCSTKCRGSSSNWKAKQQRTFQNKYGVNRPAQNSEVHNKMKCTTFRNYGVEYSQQSAEVRKKTKTTNIRQFGCENFTQTNYFRVKRENTFRERYNGRSPTQSHIPSTSWHILQDPQKLQELNTTKNLVEIADGLGVSVSLISRYFAQYQLSPIPHFNNSIPEQELKDFITGIGVTGIFNSRKIIPPKEIDIWLPDFNLAIEFCGLYWHSDVHDRITPNYHSDKLSACQQHGIQLLTFFEDEWYEKRNVIENIIKHKLHKQPSTFARKCSIRDVTKNQKQQFFNRYHIQGTGHGSINYGLYDENQMVACITFINHGKGRYELNRFATIGSVVGGFSKLLTHFQRNNTWTNILSFADRRFSVGDVYIKNGFELTNTSKPGYYYTTNKKRFHRKTFMKRFLPKYLPTFDPNLTEWENMDNHNIHRIWDCGQLRFELKNI